jgi:glucose/arabinose dehydrogenase
MGNSRTALALAAVIALAVSGCTGSAFDPPASPSAASSPSVLDETEVEPAGPVAVVASGLDAPWSVILDGDDALVSERDSGDILQLRGDGSRRTV